MPKFNRERVLRERSKSHFNHLAFEEREKMRRARKRQRFDKSPKGIEGYGTSARKAQLKREMKTCYLGN